MAMESNDTARWVCLEVFGHREHFGQLTEIERFGAKFARIEIRCPKGHFVGAPAYAGSAIFSITDVAEEDARRHNQYVCPHADCRQPTPALPAHRESYLDNHEDDGDVTAAPEAGGSTVAPEDATALLAAARVLVEQSIGDYTYSVREREGLGWEGPKVKAWSDASVTLSRIVEKYPEASTGAQPALGCGCPDCREDCASWVALGEGCKRPAAVSPPPDPTDDVSF